MRIAPDRKQNITPEVKQNIICLYLCTDGCPSNGWSSHGQETLREQPSRCLILTWCLLLFREQLLSHWYISTKPNQTKKPLFNFRRGVFIGLCRCYGDHEYFLCVFFYHGLQCIKGPLCQLNLFQVSLLRDLTPRDRGNWLLVKKRILVTLSDNDS